MIDPQPISPGTVLAAQLVPGPDGNLYVFTWNKGLWRLDRAGQADELGRSEQHSIPHRRHDEFPAALPRLTALRSDRRDVRHRHGRLPDEEPQGCRQVPHAQRHRPGRQDQTHGHLAVPQRGDSADRRQGQHLHRRPGQAGGSLLSGVLRRQAAAPAQAERRRRSLLVQLHVRQHHQVPADGRHHLAPERPAEKLVGEPPAELLAKPQHAVQEALQLLDRT